MKNNIFFLLLISVLIGTSVSVKAQDLLKIIDEEYPNTPQYEIATFKATRLSIGQSIENRKKGVLQLMVMNRYWNLPNNVQTQSFVADKWSARFGLEYGLTDKFTIGGGWTSLEDTYDGYLKYRLIRQQKNSKKHFASVTLFQNASYNGNSLEDTFSKKLAFTSQVLIARKFTPNFSLQIAPTFIYRNATAVNNDSNSHFAIGIGGRYKLANHVSLVSEYYHVTNPITTKDTYGAFALGVNWDVRFLMLQFQMTNTRSMVEDAFILQTPNNFNTEDGNFVFGFNAVFTLN